LGRVWADVVSAYAMCHGVVALNARDAAYLEDQREEKNIKTEKMIVLFLSNCLTCSRYFDTKAAPFAGFGGSSLDGPIKTPHSENYKAKWLARKNVLAVR
jgi:hypothetical protein